MLVAPVGGEPATLRRLARELSDGADELNRIRRRADAAGHVAGGEAISRDLVRLTRWLADSADDVRRRAAQLEADQHRRRWWQPDASPMAPWFSGRRCPDFLVTGQFVSGFSDGRPKSGATEHLRVGTACTTQTGAYATVVTPTGLAPAPGILRITEEAAGDGPDGAGPPADVPRGFTSHERFAEFGRRLHAALRRAGYTDAQAAVRGSSVTGFSWKSGKPFDLDRLSDLDVAVASPSAMRRARALGMDLRAGGTRSAPLTSVQLRKLGLGSLADSLSAAQQRPVTIMLYESIDGVAARGAFVTVPGS